MGLQWQDVDLHEGVLHVRRQFTRLGEYAPPKSRAAIRRIPLSRGDAKQLAALKLRSRHSSDDDPVFAARNGNPLGHRNATRSGFEAAAQEAGIKGVPFHSMRHAFASRMIDRGISSTVLAALMGHEAQVNRLANRATRARPPSEQPNGSCSFSYGMPLWRPSEQLRR